MSECPHGEDPERCETCYADDAGTTTAALDDMDTEQALDLLEKIVREWTYRGDGYYWLPSTSTAEQIADLLSLRRPYRWTRTTTSLHWNPTGEKRPNA